jgi:hypothetical protein
MRERDYAYEALAEVTNSDPSVARGALNAALRDIKAQSEIEDSYLLGAEVHERSKQYLAVFPDAALTPTALAKHWTRLPEEAKKLKRGGVNLHAPEPELERPVSSRERNLEEARKILAMFEK